MWHHIFFNVQELILLAFLFSTIALAVRGIRALHPNTRQVRNWRVNLAYFSFDLLIFVPLIALVEPVFRAKIGEVTAINLQGLPAWLVPILAVIVSDFVGYWRHRLMHSTALWPVHAAHHSDEDLTWFTLVRFHPLNRLIAVFLDVVILSALGFPLWAVVFSNRVRHYYGYFVHCDLGWRYGPLKTLLVSPFLHRWHHAVAEEARDKNFATIFSLYDVIFGTFYCPLNPAKQLGVSDINYPSGFVGQLNHPIKLAKVALFSFFSDLSAKKAARTKSQS